MKSRPAIYEIKRARMKINGGNPLYVYAPEFRGKSLIIPRGKLPLELMRRGRLWLYLFAGQL